jgi:ribonuclease HI
MLQANDVITKTQSAVVLESLISQFMFNKASEGPSRITDRKEISETTLFRAALPPVPAQ